MHRQSAVLVGASFLVTGVLLGAQVPSQAPLPREAAAAAQAKAGDQAFVMQALMAGMAEVARQAGEPEGLKSQGEGIRRANGRGPQQGWR
jgi:hypothetical protein